MRQWFLTCLIGSLLCWTDGAHAQSHCIADPENWSVVALKRSLSTPLGLPPVPHPHDNPPSVAKIELGRKLFFDRRLSINRTMSCAMCHVPEQGFTNWELSTAIGVEGRSLKRNSPSILNVGYLNVLFHDGRDHALETQFIGPLTARNEMANPSAGYVVALLRELADYAQMFEDAFEAQASLDRIGMALGAYQRTILAGNSPFDQWYFGGDETAVSADVKRGFQVFNGKAGCSACHLIEDDHALFTDELFHDTGYGQMREEKRQNPPTSIPVQVAPGVVHQMEFSKIRSVSAEREADLGRYEVTEDPVDRWRFRTPSLRNLTVTPPYMHDGHLSSISQVIEFYDQGGSQLSGQDPRIRPLGLTGAEKQDLEAFLQSLTSPDLDCLISEARVLPPDNH
ncbi:Cytochrome c551 peroxidase precursor [Pseudovibrio sp. W64]|uniref:cytochrome c peroxidase n=1 Tax=Pseudovibrio sp. W64 TaxID=1735583 RepID=UPI0007AE5AFB|nr:cytochrome c peroxidase [Pseudovibrio sp. W64]KZK78727.1 Cytochrome c551 peroxidase precursor [Pseudovibrio sp. W64]